MYQVGMHSRFQVDIRFLRSLSAWYVYAQPQGLPPRVLNALDSLTAYFEEEL